MSNDDDNAKIYDTPFSTTKRPREALIDSVIPRITSLSPDVCLTPRGSKDVPVPYNIYVHGDKDDLTTTSVRFRGCHVYTLRSITQCCFGDGPGSSKGVVSGTQGDICHPLTSAAAVRAEGALIVRHGDKFHMNNRNTIGIVRFIDDTNIYKTPAAYIDSHAQIVHFSDENVREEGDG